ncbi:hypothetical protein FALCPG4_007037 [Fusarium falciforme]
METFEAVIAKYDRVFFVIDALDECAFEDRTGLLNEIFRLQTGNKVHLFATSDPDPDVERMFANTSSLEIKADQEDVRSYLERSMDELPDFVKEDTALKEEIKDTIIKDAPGSLLAVVLQIESLAVIPPTEDLRAALVGVARDSPSAPYDAMYEAAMSRVESQARAQAGLAKHKLAYTLCARCPWTAAELCHALMVEVGETKLNWDTIPSLQAIITARSGMMVTIGNEERHEQDDVDDSNGDDGSDEAAMMRLIWRTNMRLDRVAVLEKSLSLKGAMPNARDNTGCTPLSWAVQSNRTNVSAVIKQPLGVERMDSNAEDKQGWTPLSLAVQDNKASDLVELLLTEGAGRVDINHEDREGRTPLTLALKSGHEVVVGQLRAVGAREKNDEDEKQQGIEIFRAEADGAACEKEAKTQQERDGDSQSALSGEVSSTDSCEKNRWQRERRRWLSPNWFHDAPAGDDGDSDDNDRDWRVDSGDEGKEEEFGPLCKALDLNWLSSSSPPGRFLAIAKLGKVGESWESGPCAMCKLLAAIRPPVDHGDCELYAYSSTATWLSRDKAAAKNCFMSNWVDPVILGVESETSRYSAFSMGLYRSPMRFEELDDSDILPDGFISRVGSNDRHRLRSITGYQLQADQADFDRARGWIACCAAYHRRRCNLPTGGPITSFRLINYTIRGIVDGQPAINQFIALSYV